MDLRYTSYPAALEALSRKLRAREFSFDEYHVVLTPDRYTLQVEKALFSDSGALDCEVLTLSRLARRVCGKRKTLSREGGVMLTARAIAEIGDLEYYARAAKFPEFARDVYAALLQVSSSAVDIIELADKVSGSTGRGGVTGAKLRDLAKIKTKYEELKELSLDSPDRLKALISDAATSELIKKSHFYAIGYSDATELIAEVFKTISGAARSFERFDAAPPALRAHKDLKVYKATDAISQYKEVACKIRDYVYNGGRYGDISIIAPAPRALCRILNEYGVEYYADTSVSLFETSPFAALAHVIKLATETESDRIIALCKNPYSSVDPVDADELEQVLVSRGIRFNAFTADLKSVRASRALERVKKLTDTFTAQTEFVKACAAVLEAGDFDGIERGLSERANSLSGDSGLVMTDAVAPIRSLLELIETYGTGDFKTDSLMFFSAAKSVKVKSLPRFSDRVSVVGAESLRLSACKLLFVVDFNEGVLPVPTADSGLISDVDIAASGGAIKPSAKEKNRRSREELIAVVNNAEHVFCTYCDAGKTKKAALLSSLGGIEIDGVKAAQILNATSEPTLIAYRACVPSAARELVARERIAYPDAVEDALIGPRYSQRLAAPFNRYVIPLPHRSISVSELSGWFYCPYKRFLDNTVGISERKTGELSAPDFGTIIHEFMEKFIKDKSYKLPEAELADRSKALALEIIENTELQLSDADKARIVRDACDYALLNAHIIRAGAYEPDTDMIELGFEGDIKFGKAQIPFKGKIDRVDRCGTKVRIVDYKTNAEKDLDGSKCRDGRDMQLPLYAAELKATGNFVTGMFYIPLPKKYTVKEKSLLAGKLIKDIDIAAEYDGNIPSGEKSEILGVKYNPNTGSFGNTGRLTKKEEFDLLIESCVKTASLAADEIESGYVERSPCAGACKFCPYSGLCDEKFPRTGASERANVDYTENG